MKCLVSLLCCSVLLCCHAAADEPLAFSLAETGAMKWQKGNMHTHSLWSDGDDYPEMIAAWYQKHGYQFLVFTDHNVLHNTERWIDVEKNKGGQAAFEKLLQAFPENWVDTRESDGRQEVRLKQFDEVFERFARPGEYLLIQGEEISDAFQRRPVHLCATHLSEVLPPMHGASITDTIQNNINAALARRERTGEKTLVHLNHPNFGWAVTAEQLMPVIGERFFEVYNGHPSVRNNGDATHASTERMWDIVNTWRLARLDLPLMYGLSTDDGHNYHMTESGKGSQPGRGWVMVLTEKLDPDSLVMALEAGQFYASSGVTLSSITWDGKELHVDVAAEPNESYRIDFIGTMRGFDETTQPASEDETQVSGLTRIYSEDVGRVFQTVEGTSATWQATGNELYVRAVVTASTAHPNPAEGGDRKQAWVQPVVVSSAPTTD